VINRSEQLAAAGTRGPTFEEQLAGLDGLATTDSSSWLLEFVKVGAADESDKAKCSDCLHPARHDGVGSAACETLQSGDVDQSVGWLQSIVAEASAAHSPLLAVTVTMTGPLPTHVSAEVEPVLGANVATVSGLTSHS